MPQNSNLDLNSPTIGTIFKTVGVVLSDGAEKLQKTILGAYYDSAPETKGLYIVYPDATVDYFDIDVVNVQGQGDGSIVRFKSGDTGYVLRVVYEEDGEWISDLKTALPIEVLEGRIYQEATPAIEKYLGVNLGDTLPFFEDVEAYFDEAQENVTALGYFSTFGSYIRQGAEWQEEDFAEEFYEDFSVVSIPAEQVASIVETFDTNNGLLPVKDVEKFISPTT